MLETNKIYQGDALQVLKTFPSESINCLMTSPPYWALRDYGSSVESIWDEKEGCEHEWIVNKIKDPMDRGGKGQHDSGGIVGKMGKTIWNRPSRTAFAERDVDGVCPVCGKVFESKPNQVFCSLECLNKLSNEERQSKSPISNFCSKCGAWKGQLGLEPTFDLYIKHLCDIFDEVKRVLRKDGTCWVNMGDTYGQNWRGGKEFGESSKIQEGNRGTRFANGKDSYETGLKEKSLCNIPARFSIEMQNRGWILRNTIIWHKPNCMPSSVKDRFTVDFEYLFFFVKNKKYWFETQYEEAKTNQSASFNLRVRDVKRGYACKSNQYKASKEEVEQYHGQNIKYGSKRTKRCVWSICPRPFKEAHFATYPESFCETPLKAGCPEFVCNKCGKAREKIIKRELAPSEVFTNKNTPDESFSGSYVDGEMKGQGQKLQDWRNEHPDKFLGYSDCGCNSTFSGGIVLDPFFGAGTTGLVALKQNKNFVGIELSPDYIKIAEKRLKPFLEQLKLIPHQIN